MRTISTLIFFCVAGFAQQTQSANETYIGRGKIDLAVAGNLSIPHATSGSVSGHVFVDAGYYVSRNSLVGGDFSVSASSGPAATQTYGLGGHYRYLFQTRSPRLFPYFGATPGMALYHYSGGTTTAFTLRGEAGVKCFVARNVSIEAAYNLAYAHPTRQSIQDSWASVLGFGFAYTFR